MDKDCGVEGGGDLTQFGNHLWGYGHALNAMCASSAAANRVDRLPVVGPHGCRCCNGVHRCRHAINHACSVGASAAAPSATRAANSAARFASQDVRSFYNIDVTEVSI